MSSFSVSSPLPPSLQTSLGTVVITSLGWDTGTVPHCRCGFWRKKYLKDKFEKIAYLVTLFLWDIYGQLDGHVSALLCGHVYTLQVTCHVRHVTTRLSLDWLTLVTRHVSRSLDSHLATRARLCLANRFVARHQLLKNDRLSFDLLIWIQDMHRW